MFELDLGGFEATILGCLVLDIVEVLVLDLLCRIWLAILYYHVDFSSDPVFPVDMNCHKGRRDICC